MFNLLNRSVPPTDLLSSKLFSEDTFYDTFIKDLNLSLHEVIIESPFITNRRLSQLLPIFKKLKDRRVRVIINTRDPNEENCAYRREEAHKAVASLRYYGIQVIYTEGHHRKLAIIDRQPCILVNSFFKFLFLF